jgi:hypothetical protein
MDPDILKKAWNTQSSQSRLTVDVDQLLRDLQRQEQCFTAKIFWRDSREVGVALLMVPLWCYLGVKLSLHWTWYLMVPAMLWIALYMLVDRMRQKRQLPEPGDSLRCHAESLLAQVEHQVSLLRSVLWWYLLPLGLSALPFFSQIAWQERSAGWPTALGASLTVAVMVLAFAFIYWLNQCSVRTELEPRRRELQTLLMSLKDETPAAS